MAIEPSIPDAAAAQPAPDVADRLAGTLLGTALGDALGLPVEGMRAERVARRFGPLTPETARFRLLGRTGFISDDAEQSALVAQSLARHSDDPEACARAFRRALLGWFARLPWGIGFGTLRACGRSELGLHPSGVPSAGNGAAMRAAVIGVFFAERPEERERFGRGLAQVTHTDARAIEGALYVAEVAAKCGRSSPDTPPIERCQAARGVVRQPQLAEALDRALDLARRDATLREAATALGTSGFVVHTVPFCAFCFARFGTEPLAAITAAIAGGGDTDSTAAIVGAWSGALHGEAGLPALLLRRIHDGPFGPTHLRALARCLALRRAGQRVPSPRFSAPAAFARNLALYPVVLAHGFRRLVPL
jgi:ADP-ribosylglycohydrolase